MTTTIKNWDFYQLWREAGFNSVHKLARFLDVCPRTVRNWERSGRPPVAVRRLLDLLAGDLGGLHPDWAGFRFHGAELRGPNSEWITPGMIRAYPHLERAVEHFRAEALAKTPPTFLTRLSAALKAFQDG
jgi:hypothetical protein